MSSMWVEREEGVVRSVLVGEHIMLMLSDRAERPRLVLFCS